MIVPDVEDDDDLQLPTAEPVSHPGDELVEWWNEDESASSLRRTEPEGDDMLPVILGLGATAIICVLIGVFAVPMLLAPVFENQLGVVVENNADLRPLGGLLGLLAAAFIGAIGVWVAGPRR